MVLIQVNRNGAKNRMQMARELAKHPSMRNLPMSEVIATLRSYEATGDLYVSECFITLKHYC